jgi:L-ascorbate metabolism protein UlaG (beta-lactamase superfamily)
MRVTFVAHATVLAEEDGHAAIFDPHFSARLAYLFSKRRVALPLAAEALPRPEAVLVSHAHFDHLDAPSLRKFPRETPVVTARSLGPVIGLMGRRERRGIDWWEAAKVAGFDVTAVPAYHFSGRPPWFFLRNDYQGYVLQGDRTIYFAGDTGLDNQFAAIGERFDIDLAILPIGAYEPPSFRRHHLSPEDALEATRRLGAKALLPVHYGAFSLSWEPFGEPPVRMARVAAEAGWADRVHVIPPGSTIEI